jgi:uncharacterized protein DUF3303
MLYMVVERFKEGSVPEIYRRLREKGRMMPEGLEYVASWIDLDFKTCWQVMKTEDEKLFRVWTDVWSDLMHFKIIPVHSSAEMVEMVAREL